MRTMHASASDIGVSASAGTATRPAGWPTDSAESASTSHTGTPAGMKAARSREVTTALGKLNLNITSAHIATFGEKVVDVKTTPEFQQGDVLKLDKTRAVRLAP